jgi:hypothetical protein
MGRQAYYANLEPFQKSPDCVISVQLGGVKLAWDPGKETFPGNEAANQLINRPLMRAPWKLA